MKEITELKYFYEKINQLSAGEVGVKKTFRKSTILGLVTFFNMSVTVSFCRKPDPFKMEKGTLYTFLSQGSAPCPIKVSGDFI